MLGKHLLDDMLAERKRRAKVIHAERELQATEKLFQATKILAQEPQAIQLRHLETLTVIEEYHCHLPVTNEPRQRLLG